MSQTPAVSCYGTESHISECYIVWFSSNNREQDVGVSCERGKTYTVCECCCTVVRKYTVEPPNNGHVGDTLGTSVLSIVRRLSLLRRF